MSTPDLVACAQSLKPLVRECAAESDAQRCLPKHLVDAFCKDGLYRIAVPAAVGGHELDPMSQIRVIEALSEGDGAAGWTLMIGAEVMGLLAAALEPEHGRALFADPDLVVAGALNPLGRAVAEADGYRASGQWPFASGCQVSTHFWGQCVVIEDDEPVRNADGRVKWIEIVVPRDEFEIIDTWNVSGMRGSGSHDVRVDEVFVPRELVTDFTNHSPSAIGPLFRIPNYTRLAYNKVGVSTGIARAAIEHFKTLAATKVPRASFTPLCEHPDAQLAMAEAEAELGSARAWIFETVEELWQTALAGDPMTHDLLARVHLSCTHACAAAVRTVSKLHAFAGTSVNNLTSSLERCYRDVPVVRQHLLVSQQWYQSTGRTLLGSQNNSPYPWEGDPGRMVRKQ